MRYCQCFPRPVQRSLPADCLAALRSPFQNTRLPHFLRCLAHSPLTVRKPFFLVATKPSCSGVMIDDYLRVRKEIAAGRLAEKEKPADVRLA
jgi:hypothetical protein